ncbi:MAG TPA: GH25 family lysozyme [Candidatus Saccharimonadales bacterium]
MRSVRRSSARKARRNPGRSFCDLSNNNAFSGIRLYDPRVYARTHPFLVHKATQGTNFIDSLHAERCEITHTQGIPVGHYHFMDGFGDGKRAVTEADHFLKTVLPHFMHHKPESGLRNDFLILDIETPQTSPNECIRAFESRIDAEAKLPVICYTGLSYFMSHRLRCKSRKWWLAAYPGPLPRKLPDNQLIWAHQFSDNGKCEGVAGACDMSLLVDNGSIKYWDR